MALAARQGPAALAKAGKLLRHARPTAVNLMHAVDAMLKAGKNADPAAAVRHAAEEFHRQDLSCNKQLAILGAALLKKNSRIITYCNAGTLATSGLGTAVGVIKYAHQLGLVSHVYPCETRPYLQGSRLTLWELMQAKVPATLITDNMAAHVMKTCGINAVIVGADRITANGDVCNKIGTYGLAILAKYHRIPFYVVAPTSTIEERDPAEVLNIFGRPIAPQGAHAHHFAFDVTPHNLVTAIVTEKGVKKRVPGWH
jgi:methylthioribose-1-phosphate isomerase